MPDHADPPGIRGAERPGIPALLDRLPAFYRESPGFLEPLLDAADERIAELRDGIVRAERELPESIRHFAVEVGLASAAPPAGSGSSGGWASAACARAASGSGTRGDLRAWVAERFGGAPRLVEGLEAVTTGDRWIALRRASQAWALLVWDRASLPVPPPDFHIPRELLPVSVGVQALLVARLPSPSRLLSGERMRGTVFWQSLPSRSGSAWMAGSASTAEGGAAERRWEGAEGEIEKDR